LRRNRPWIAVLLAFVLVFAQALTAAYACPILDASQRSAAANDTDAMAPDCADMPAEPDATANLCEAHCLPGQQTAQADPPSASIAPQPALIVRLADAPRRFSDTGASLAPISTAPPPRLRFSRLLI
jgi:hypothetical protein